MERYFIISSLIFILCHLCRGNSYENLRKLITRDETINWLKTVELHNNSSPYCRLCCVNITTKTVGKNCGAHTLCKFSNQTGPNCRGYINVLFTHSEKQAILDIHNTLRDRVATGMEKRGSPGPQPKAANMRLVEWNDELALIAERWAAQCIFAHDKCRDTESFPVGQNLARGNLATNNELSLVGEWYDGVREFNNLEVPSFNLPTTHVHFSAEYTQLVWADTYQIGCARAIFQKYYSLKTTYREHLICNYGPSGNIPSQPVYKIGPPCSSCPEGTSCSLEYQGLCASERDAGQSRKLSRNDCNINNISMALLLSVYVFYSVYLYLLL